MHLLLVSFILGDLNWIFLVASQLPCGQLYKLRFEVPHLVFRHKVYEIALSEVLATQMGVTEMQLVCIVQI